MHCNLVILTLFILSLLCAKTSAQSQNKIADSLEFNLRTEKNDTVKINLLAQLSFELYASNPQKSAEYVEKGIILSKKRNYLRGLAICLHNQGVLFYFQGDKTKAVKVHLESLHLAEKHQYEDLIGANLSRIGNINREQGDLVKASINLLQAVEILRKIPQNYYLSYALSSLGIYYQTKKQYAKALKSFEESYQIAAQIGHPKQMAICWYFIAETYLQQEKFDTSLAYFQKCIFLNKKVGSIILDASAYNHIARIFLHKKLIDEAKTNAEKAHQLALSVNSKHEMLGANQSLYEIYKVQGDFQKAIAYLEKATILKDSLFNDSRNKTISELQNNFELNKKELEIEKQNKAIFKQRILIYAIIAGFLVILIISFLFYRNILYKKKAFELLEKRKNEIEIQKEALQLANQKIQEQNKEITIHSEELTQLNEELTQSNQEIVSLNNHLERMVSEKTHELKQTIQNLMAQNQDLEQFAYIVSHNLRAPVARFKGLLSILDRNKITDDYNLGMLCHMDNVANNLDEILRDLTNVITIRKGVELSKEKVNLKEISMNILTHFKEEIDRIDVEIKLDFETNNEIISVKAYVQSIIYNLISNAIKYRNPERKLILNIQQKNEGLQCCFVVNDNGLGIDLNLHEEYKIFGLYKRLHNHIEGKGLGLYLVKTQLESIGGSIKLTSEVNVGSTFTVYFPLE